MESISNPKPSISILVVEDEFITLEFLVIILTRKFPDAAIHKANNGRAGLELFKSHLPDVVITDINMPEMGGVQMADKIRTIKPDIKFIALSSCPEKLILPDSSEKEFVFDHYIDKPIDHHGLFEAIEQCLGEIAQQ